MLVAGARSVLVTVTATVFALSSLALGSTSITFAAEADIVPTIVNGPTSARQGEQISIFDRIRNLGTASAGSSFTVGFYLSTSQIINPSKNIFLGSRTVPCCLTTSTPVSSTSQTNTQVVIPSNVSPGTYYLGVYADIPLPNGVIMESNETNNSLAVSNSITISRSSGGGDNNDSGGGCGSIMFGDDDHTHFGTVRVDFLVLLALLILLYVRRHRRQWTKDGIDFSM